MSTEKNIYGLSEGVFAVCQYLGLKFPTKIPNKLQNVKECVPSDYFGDNVELTWSATENLCTQKNWDANKFSKTYKNFSEKFSSQKKLKHTKTELTVYFCDHILFAENVGASVADYFDFEFYNKSFALRNTFFTTQRLSQTQMICNDFFARDLLLDKSKTNVLFADFLHRDWLNTRDCTFEKFNAFVEKHPRFFSKPIDGSQGRGAEIINIAPNTNREKLFERLASDKRILEELIVQHESLRSFCPNVVNTIRINTLLDVHNVVHILTASGRFGKAGQVIDNLHGGGVAVVIDPTTGIVTSDGINELHERTQKHPDTRKIFKGFRYPSWDKVRSLVTKAAKMIPKMRHVGWDVTVNDRSDAILVEANGHGPDLGLQQAPDSVGRFHLYQPLLEELLNYKAMQMRILGYRVNDLPNVDSVYESYLLHPEFILKLVKAQLVSGCTGLMDLGCRQFKILKSVCTANVKYYPVDRKKYDGEIILCDFNKGEFPDIKADTCFCAFTAEFVEQLPQFLKNMCNAAKKQILMFCRPVDKEIDINFRWNHPFLTDFTEEFLISFMKQNNFEMVSQYFDPNYSAIVFYDFRRTD